jgi:hypothetical protein
MAKKAKIPESGPARLKDNPRPQDLAATKSPLARLVAWLR